MNINLLIILTFFISIGVNAHGNKKHDSMSLVKHDTVTVVGTDTIAINGVPIINGKIDEEAPAKTFRINLVEQAFEHLHNKLVHFPIALGTIAFIFSILNLKWNYYEKAIVVLVALTVVFSAAAYFTGISQIEPFINSGKEDIISYHRAFGISISVGSALWFVFLLNKKLKKYGLMIASLIFVLIMIAGFLGGLITHG